MIVLKLITLGVFLLLTLFVFSLYLMWSDAIGADRLTNACTSAVSATSASLLVSGLILAGDAAFLRRKIWICMHRVLLTATGLLVLLFASIAGLSLAAIAGTSFRTVVVSADQSIILMNHDTPGVFHNIGQIDANSEQTVLLRTGTRLLGYRIVTTECSGAHPPVQIPSWLDGPVPRIHFKTSHTGCNHEVLQDPDRTDSDPPPRQ